MGDATTLPAREKLPDRRASWTQKVRIGGHTIHVGFGEYEDGRLGEVFIDCAKQGTFTSGVLGALARSLSTLLQYGVPVAEVVSTVRSLDFPPNGRVTGSPAVEKCTSVADYVAAEIAARYLPAAGEAQA